MKYGSLCSGIEAASVAWQPLGWHAAWFSEIEPFPCAVLAHHYPNVPNYGDMTVLVGRILSGEIEAPDILVGGTPCQAFSTAGLRGSLNDERGNLTLVLIRILDAIDFIRQRQGKRPCILVWENVPGVLSTKDNAFGCFLGGLAGEDCPLQPSGKKWTNAGCVLGHQRSIAWRVLDAQYFGVPQRRRRIFLVASAGDINPTEILFERKGLPRDIKTSRSTQQKTTTYAESSFGTFRESSLAGTLKAKGGCLGGGSENLMVVNGRQDPVVYQGTTGPLDTYSQSNVISIAGNIIGRNDKAGGNGNGYSTDGISYTLTCTDIHAVAVPVAATLTTGFGGRGVDADQIINGNCAINNYQIRRLTPKECERLQGFPDGYTMIPYRGKSADDCPDSPRYKALGNSMAIPVMYWIGEKIKYHILNK